MIGFNVSVKNHGDIVIFRETPIVRTYFLTSPAGMLRKVIESRKPENGEGEFKTTELRPSALKKRFNKEKKGSAGWMWRRIRRSPQTAISRRIRARGAGYF